MSARARAAVSVDERVSDVASLAVSLYDRGGDVALANRHTLQCVVPGTDLLGRELRVNDEVVSTLQLRSDVVEVRRARLHHRTPGIGTSAWKRRSGAREGRASRHARLPVRQPPTPRSLHWPTVDHAS